MASNPIWQKPSCMAFTRSLRGLAIAAFVMFALFLTGVCIAQGDLFGGIFSCLFLTTLSSVSLAAYKVRKFN
jgi:hypothetical protein